MTTRAEFVFIYGEVSMPVEPDDSRKFEEKPKVTVGVCVRNSANTLNEAIDSIVAQDFPHQLMEVIFVDDGSEDETLSLIKKNASKINVPIRVFHSSWKGIGHARNLVASNASGEYILWLDGDMCLSTDFVRKLFGFMEQHPEVGIAKGKQAIEPGENLLATLESYSRAAGRMTDYRSKKGHHKALGTGGSIYRVKALLQVRGFDEDMRGYGEDWDAELRIREAGWILDTVNVKFSDFERRKLTWGNLWKRYWLRGYYSHYFLHKNKGMMKNYRMLPPMAFLAGFLASRRLFRLTGQRLVFFLPSESMFKATAWTVGFLESHFRAYQPNEC